MKNGKSHFMDVSQRAATLTINIPSGAGWQDRVKCSGGMHFEKTYFGPSVFDS